VRGDPSLTKPQKHMASFVAGWEFLAGPSLRGLQGIQFSVTLYLRGLQVSGHATGADPPLDRGVRKAQAVFARGKLFGFLATFTLLDNRVAVTSVKLTPLLAHKKAINTFFYRCTNHGYHILSSRLLLNQRSHPNWVRALAHFMPYANSNVKRNVSQKLSSISGLSRCEKFTTGVKLPDERVGDLAFQ
jgi:hypothetical protein